MTLKHNKIIERALLIRLVEEKLLNLFKEGKINGTVHTCVGQELIPVCVAEYLTNDDFVLSNHRGHGHLLSRDNDLVGFFAELMGRKVSICGGMGGSQHLYRTNHLSNGIQGGMTPIAAGIALANKINKNNRVVVCYIGDGTLGEGVIYEAFNLASLWNLPVIFVLENNRIAQSTSIEQTMSGSIELRAKGFGLQYLRTNVWDIEDMLETFKDAVILAKEHSRATFIEVDAYRLNSHSKGDDNRDPSEVNRFQLRDLINIEIESNNVETSNILLKINESINNAVQIAEELPILDKIEIETEVKLNITFSDIQETIDSRRVNELIYEGIKNGFTNNNNMIMIGEDIEYITPWTKMPYGGAFKVSKDLSVLFENVKNTPISEAAITGIGTGLAIGGMKPIVEIMFGDFMTLTFDQLINHACKFYKMYNRQLSIPLVLRTPMGGKRGYGPTHSQSIEKHFIGIPDLLIIVLNHRISPISLYNSIFLENKPCLVIENKVLYTKTLDTKSPVGYRVQKSNENYPTIRITPINNKADVTILCYGEILEDIEKAIEIAFYEEEILCEIICPTLINPINIDPIILSLSNTHRLLTVEEGPNIASYSSEVSSMLMEKNISLKSYKRIANNNVIPSSYKAEINMLPNSNSIFQKIKEAYYE